MAQSNSRIVPRIRLVPDTGFYIAAALQNGYARSYLIGRGSKFLTYELCTSEAILLEVQDKLENSFGFDRSQVVDSVQLIRHVARVLAPRQRIMAVRDPDDNKILECALEAEADAVITFDKDLLSLKDFKGIKMVHPSMLKYWFPKP